MDPREQMKDFFTRWKKSGLSVREFGAKEGIGYPKIQYWRRRLSSAPQTNKSFSEFVPVELVNSGTPEALEVVLPNGLRCHVPQGFEAAELRRMIGALREC